MITYAFRNEDKIRKIIFENGIEFFNMPTNLSGDSICVMDDRIRELIEIVEEHESGITDLTLVSKWNMLSNDKFSHIFINDSEKSYINEGNVEPYEKIIMEFAKKYKKNLATSIPHGQRSTDLEEIKKIMVQKDIDFTFIFYSSMKNMKTRNTHNERYLKLFGKKLLVTDGVQEASPGIEDNFIKLVDSEGQTYGSMNNRVAFITMDIPHQLKKADEEHVHRKIFEQVLENLTSPDFFNVFKRTILNSIKIEKEDSRTIYNAFKAEKEKNIKRYTDKLDENCRSIDSLMDEIAKLQENIKKVGIQKLIEEDKKVTFEENFTKLLQFFDGENFLNIKNIATVKCLEIIYKTKNEEIFKFVFDYNKLILDIFDVVTGYKLFRTNQAIQVEVTSLLAEGKYKEAFMMVTNFLENKKIVTEEKAKAEVIK